MENKKKKKPRRRFKGFTEEWEQRKLGELPEKTYGGGTPSTTNTEYWNGNIPWLQSSDIADGKLFDVVPKKFISQSGLNGSAAQLVPANSIAIITRVGVGKLAFLPFSYTTSQDFLSMSKLKTEPYFTVYACYKKLQSELNAVQGTSIKGITKDELLAKEIKVPSYKEQQQIGEYFRNLDRLITLHQRKLDKLRAMKKSYLSEMFPQAGEKKPRRRFKGFTEDWEQRKLGDIATEMVAGGDVDKSLILEDGRYPVIANALINDGIVGYYNDEYRIKAPAVTVTGRGDVGHAKARNVDFTPVVRLLSIKSNHEVFFLENAINTLQIVIESTGVPQLTVPQLAKYDISFPKTLDEEEKIGSFFANLDRLITLHQRKSFYSKKWRKIHAKRDKRNRLIL